MAACRDIDKSCKLSPRDHAMFSNRAMAHLIAGNLKTAIKAVAGLSASAPGNTKAAAVAASWLADAKARLAADRAVAGLRLHALSLLMPVPPPPAGSEKG